MYIELCTIYADQFIFAIGHNNFMYQAIIIKGDNARVHANSYMPGRIITLI